LCENKPREVKSPAVLLNESINIQFVRVFGATHQANKQTNKKQTLLQKEYKKQKKNWSNKKKTGQTKKQKEQKNTHTIICCTFDFVLLPLYWYLKIVL
jgi:isoaspartyl peptidase/L-asparaginase-like protein (Ntn-hydrolase superfamily)